MYIITLALFVLQENLVKKCFFLWIRTNAKILPNKHRKMRRLKIEVNLILIWGCLRERDSPVWVDFSFINFYCYVIT